MSSQTIRAIGKRVRRIGNVLLVLSIVLIPASRMLLVKVFPNAVAAASKNAKATKAPSKPTKPPTASAKTPKATKNPK